MSLGCGTTCIKYLLFLFNLIFVITGIIIIAVGISVKDYYIDYETFVDKRYMYAPQFLISIGVLIFIISFFGCCGTIKENACLTLAFSSLLLLIFFLELAAGIGGYFLRNSTHEFLAKRLTDTIQNYKIYNDVTFAWDSVQKDFKCCGVYKSADWLNVNSTHNKIPNSCCDLMVGGIDAFECSLNTTTLHLMGCLEAFGNFISTHTYTIEAAGLGIAFVQFMGITLSCYLSSQIRRGYQTV